jgi:dTDP-4-dehydrorhamnose 3,5-epimerase
MKFIDTEFEGLKVIEPPLFRDARGFFFESYNEKLYKDNGIDCEFVQDNHSMSAFGVLRGLHFQKPPFEQAKLVRVISGRVYDVAVDLRKSSKTYLKWFGIELSAENRLQLFIPRGFAHGFITLSDVAEFCYKCDNSYSKEHDGGILYSDPTFGIDWKLPSDQLITSEKDAHLPLFDNLAFLKNLK